jgi:hypothetical protein
MTDVCFDSGTEALSVVSYRNSDASITLYYFRCFVALLSVTLELYYRIVILELYHICFLFFNINSTKYIYFF